MMMIMICREAGDMVIGHLVGLAAACLSVRPSVHVIVRFEVCDKRTPVKKDILGAIYGQLNCS